MKEKGKECEERTGKKERKGRGTDRSVHTLA